MTVTKQTPKPPIQSGWRGELSGCVEGTNSAYISVSEVTLRLDHKTAYALANLLCDSSIERSQALEGSQVVAMSNLGAALGRLIDHPAANNGGRECVK